MSGNPVEVPGPGGWKQIQAAYQQTLAIKEDGSLWHWSEGSYINTVSLF
jgi:hypothetical protein